MSGLEQHHRAVARALEGLGLGWDAWPGVILDSRLAPADRLSAVLVLLAGSEGDLVSKDTPIVQIVGQEDAGIDQMGRARLPWERVPRLTLPWTSQAATVAIQVVTRQRAYDDRRISIALRGAGQVCSDGRADTKVLDALASCSAYLDHVGEEHYRVKELRALVRRVIASATHPDLLDLSLLVQGDTWAAPAREAARAAPALSVAPLVRLLCGLGPRKPSANWSRAVAESLSDPAAQEMLRAWISLATEAEVVPEHPAGDLTSCPGTLFVGVNTDTVRAAVWATPGLPDTGWPVEQLGVLARRGAAHNGLPKFPEALSLKVATAAVDVLIARGGDDVRRELGALFTDLQRRDLLRKIGQSLGRESETVAREAELVTERAREQRRKASPTTRKARSAMDSLLRQRFGPMLRDRGFAGGPRTWTRRHHDRVDVLRVAAGPDPMSGHNRLRVSYGVRFAAAHSSTPLASGSEPVTPAAPYGDDVAEALAHGLDLDLVEYGDDDRPGDLDDLDETSLAATEQRLRDTVIPFLDSLGDYDAAMAALEAGRGVPAGATHHTNPGSFAHCDAAGRLALGHGDKARAIHHLQRALDMATAWMDDPDFTSWRTREVERVTGLLAKARELT